MTTIGVQFINVDSSNPSMWAYTTNTTGYPAGIAPSAPENAPLSIFSNATATAFNYSTTNPTQPTAANSYAVDLTSLPNPHAGTEWANLVWIGTNPNINTNATSNVTNWVYINGNFATISGRLAIDPGPSTLQGAIIQDTGQNDGTGQYRQYYVYVKRPITVVNNSSGNITVQSVGATNPLANLSYTYTGQTTANSTSSANTVVTPGNSVQMNSAWPGQLYTKIYIWSGTVAIGSTASAVLSLQGFNFSVLDSAIAGNANISGTLSNNNRTLTIANGTGGGMIGGGGSPTLVPIGGSCTSTAQCANGICGTSNTCQRVAVGQMCNVNNDCTSRTCSASGICQAVANGRACTTNTDCTSGYCDPSSSLCATNPNNGGGGGGTTPVGGGCSSNSDCTSNSCIGNICQAVAVGQTCTTNTDCTSGSCTSSICRAVANDQPCTQNSDCTSNYCNPTSKICQASPVIPPTNGTTDNNGGFPWWGWLIIGIAILIVVILIIVLIVNSSKKKKPSIHDIDTTDLSNTELPYTE